MRKFSSLSNKEEKVVTTKVDFINNLIEESLTIVDGVIVGKDKLADTLNIIMDMNDSKTMINVLESVKLNSYRGGFNFETINEAIDMERDKLNAPLVEKTTEIIEEEIEVVNESVMEEAVVEITESKKEKEDCNKLKASKFLSKIFGDKYEDKMKEILGDCVDCEICFDDESTEIFQKITIIDGDGEETEIEIVDGIFKITNGNIKKGEITDGLKKYLKDKVVSENFEEIISDEEKERNDLDSIYESIINK